MATHTSITELRNMQADDLRKEASAKRMTIAKLRLGLVLRSEKDSALYRRERKDLARILTVLREKPDAAPETTLKPKRKSTKVSAPKAQ